MKRVLVRLFPELHINEHREFDGQSRRPRTDNAGPSSAYQRRENASYPRRNRSAFATGHELTESGDEETDLNSADFQGSCEVNWRRCQLELMMFPVICRVSVSTKCLRNMSAAMELSVVPEAMMTVRASRYKMKGKGEPAV